MFCSFYTRICVLVTNVYFYIKRTAICNWFRAGMSEYDVVNLAGHADFKTAHKFYLCVQDDLIHHARKATESGLFRNLLQKCCNGLLAVEDC